MAEGVIVVENNAIKIGLRKNLLAMLTGVLFLWITSLAYPQGFSNPQRDLSDNELGAFAKAYVQVHKIRSKYGPSLTRAKDAKESKQIHREANAKIKDALAKQGLAVQSYTRIYSAVNDDEGLRRRTLALIEQERKRS